MQLKAMPKLSERLIYIRKLYNLSQVELAQKAGTTQQAIQQAEKGKARQPRYLNRLAAALDIPVEWLIFGEAQTVEPALMPKSVKDAVKGFEEKSSEILDNFYAMPEKDQKLILELMKARQEK